MLTNVGRVIAGYVLLVLASIPAIAATISADQTAPPFSRVELHIEGIIEPGDAKKVARMALDLKRKNAWDLNWLHVYLNSQGGSVRESIRIGLFLRNNNASTSIDPNGACNSSCVFVLMSGVARLTYKATIGIHRPFLQRADMDQDFEKMYRDTRGELEKYFDKMRVSKGLLDLMYSVPPNEMRNLNEAIVADSGTLAIGSIRMARCHDACKAMNSINTLFAFIKFSQWPWIPLDHLFP